METTIYKGKTNFNPKSGYNLLMVNIPLYIASIILMIYSISVLDKGFAVAPLVLSIASILYIILGSVLFAGLKIVEPNEASVFVLFGNYYGTISKPGFYFINPFCTSVNPTAMHLHDQSEEKSHKSTSYKMPNKKVSLKAETLNNGKQKINDKEGNPIEIGVIVIWKVVDATKAVFEVDNYKTYVSTQTDASIRQVSRQYPYDISEEGDEKSLRGSSTEVANELKKELQARVNAAGIEIIETRIAHLAYAPEIAAAMLQRQQAAAIIAARQKIVEGAVGMVEMALNKLSEKEVVHLDEERKAQMVSNLLVVLCGNKDAQPILNSGSIY